MGQISTVTVGSDTASVYALTSNALADADSFHNVRLGAGTTAWNAAIDDDKERALLLASDWIDRSSTFSGTKTVEAQPRAWPRDGATCDGESVADGSVPDPLALATFWLAGQLLVDNDGADSEGTSSNVKSAKAGSAKVEFFSATSGNRLPKTAHDYVGCYLTGGATIITPMVSGADGESAFDECDFGRSEGFS